MKQKVKRLANIFGGIENPTSEEFSFVTFTL